MTIDTLTAFQESQIQVYLDKWMEIGLRTEAMDKEEVTKYVKFLYEKILEISTPEIHFVQSPKAAQKLMNEIVNKNDGSDLSQPLEYFEPARGNWWMSHYSFNDYLLNVIFPEKKPDFANFEEFIELSKSTHLLWMFDTFAVVSDFPDRIGIDDNSKLGDKFLPSISYRDGYAIYADEGVQMKKSKWEEETLKFKSTLARLVFRKI
jgi:hypothetical protein